MTRRNVRHFPPVSGRMKPTSFCLWRHRKQGDSNKRWRQRRFEPSQETVVKKIINGWFSDNFNFCCIICLYFGISNFKIYPVYTNSFKYIFPDLNTNNAQFGIFTSFWRLFCTNLRMKCHHRHTLVYAYK